MVSNLLLKVLAPIVYILNMLKATTVSVQAKDKDMFFLLQNGSVEGIEPIK